MLRTVLFAPEDLALVKGDPGERRRFLDDLLVAMAPAVRRGPRRLRPGAQAAHRAAEVRGPEGRPQGQPAVPRGGDGHPRRLGRAPGPDRRRAAGRPRAPGRRAPPARGARLRGGGGRRPRPGRDRVPALVREPDGWHGGRPEAATDAGPAEAAARSQQGDAGASHGERVRAAEQALLGRRCSRCGRASSTGGLPGRPAPRRARAQRPRPARPRLRQPRRVLVARARAPAGQLRPAPGRPRGPGADPRRRVRRARRRPPRPPGRPGRRRRAGPGHRGRPGRHPGDPRPAPTSRSPAAPSPRSPGAPGEPMRPDPERARLAAEALARARADAWARGERPGAGPRQQDQPPGDAERGAVSPGSASAAAGRRGHGATIPSPSPPPSAACCPPGAGARGPPSAPSSATGRTSWARSWPCTASPSPSTPAS